MRRLKLELGINNWYNIMCGVAHGLDYIHSKKVIHRDLKENNIVLYKQGSAFKPVVIDFGKSLKIPTTMKYTLTAKEKKLYNEKHRHIAPDLIDGTSCPSSASDIYSYGRLFKNIIKYSRIEPVEPIVVMIKSCLKYQATDRPAATRAIEILQSYI